MAFNADIGLDSKTYKQNILTYGLNSLPKKKAPSVLQVALNQFRSPLIYILCIAAVLTFTLGDYPEALGIVVVVILNAALGFFQEFKAEQALEHLRNEVKHEVQVLREGRSVTVLTDDITVGDVVLLKMGDKVPADGIVLNADQLSTNEAPLTGEVEPVGKYPLSHTLAEKIKHNGFLEEDVLERLDETQEVYMGSTVSSGIGKILITKIGVNAKFGQILASLANEADVDTPLQAKVKRLSRELTVIVAIVSALMVAYGTWRGYSIFEMLELTISVAVSTIPEGLPIALTIILTLGMGRILQRKALVRKLLAAETLGSVDTICIDKTGTLTLGEMQIVEVKTEDLEMFKRTIFATNQQLNSVEISLMHWLKKHISAKEQADFGEERLIERKLFNSSDKFSAALGTKYLYVVGAPELVLENTSLSQKDKAHWHQEIEYLSNKGFRLIALAYKKSNYQQHPDLKHMPDRLKWLGLGVIDDPVRPNLRSTFSAAQKAGISIRVITGDILNTAQAVLQKSGIQVLPGETMSGAELKTLDEAALQKQVENIKLFYRTSPQQKLDIVKALQANGRVVAMMGDGINDTPALKKAEIGIVVENATSFSKEVADMILLDSNFQTIIDAVAEGRNIFDKVRKMITYLLVDAFDAVILVVGALLLGLPSPLQPLQILYINIVTDGLPDLALAFEPSDPNLMKEKPLPKSTPIIDLRTRVLIASVGFVVMSVVLFFYNMFYDGADPVQAAQVQTAVFGILGLNSLFYVFSVRSLKEPIWKQDFFSNKFLLGGVFFGIMFVVAAIYWSPLQGFLRTVPLPAVYWLWIAAAVLLDLAIFEIVKYIFRNYEKKG